MINVKGTTMQILRTPRRKVVVIALGAVAAVGIGTTAYATTLPGGASPSSLTATPAASATVLSTGASTAATAPAVSCRLRKLVARADHATVEVKENGTWVTYTIDRGRVTAASATSITLARPDGQSVTDTISSSTTFKGIASASGITVGRAAVAISDNGAAVQVAQKAATPSAATPSAATAA